MELSSAVRDVRVDELWGFRVWVGVTWLDTGQTPPFFCEVDVVAVVREGQTTRQRDDVVVCREAQSVKVRRGRRNRVTIEDATDCNHS